MPWWATALLGVIGSLGKPFDLSFQGRTIHLNPVGTLQTGAAEDSRIYISLADFTEWTHVPYSTVEISASGSPEEINATIQRLTQALPGAEVRPVRQSRPSSAPWKLTPASPSCRRARSSRKSPSRRSPPCRSRTAISFRPLAAIYKKNKVLSPAMKQFLAILKNAIERVRDQLFTFKFAGFSGFKSFGRNIPSLRISSPSNHTSPPPHSGRWINTMSQCTAERLPLSHSS